MNDDSSDNNSKNELPSGLGRLIFKQMRFRELPELGEPKEDSYGPWEDRTEEQNLEVGKRDRQRLVKDLADLLTSMREQETGSTLRMPSLRFG
ncbi:hypothetical protein Bpfe_019748 [Biomphalaria pfeifferi]|nr:hypothetical protein Bpfe_019748 [Biomphalaria pfeifferi]